MDVDTRGNIKNKRFAWEGLQKSNFRSDADRMRIGTYIGMIFDEFGDPEVQISNGFCIPGRVI